MNILFFGKNSFSAQYLIKDLINDNNKLFFFSRKPSTLKNNYIFEFTKRTELPKEIKNLKNPYIFIFSSYVPLFENNSDWEKCKNINLFGIIKLLKKLKKPKKIILASSCSLYGDITKKTDELSFLKPQNNYALSKFEQESLIRIFCQINNIKFVSYRLGYVFGSNMHKKRLVIRLLKNSRGEKKIKLFNKNLNLNLIHSKDISDIIIKTYKKAEGIYNLVNKKKTNISNFEKSLKSKIKLKQNNLITSKIFSEFKHIKNLNFNKSIDLFKDGN